MTKIDTILDEDVAYVQSPLTIVPNATCNTTPTKHLSTNEEK